MKPARLLLFASLTMVAACAAPPPPGSSQLAELGGRQCFRADQVLSYTAGEGGIVDLQTAQGPFEVRMGPGCPDFSWIMQIGVRPAYSNWMCEGRGDQIITAYQTQFSRCWVGDIRALTPGSVPA